MKCKIEKTGRRSVGSASLLLPLLLCWISPAGATEPCLKSFEVTDADSGSATLYVGNRLRASFVITNMSTEPGAKGEVIINTGLTAGSLAYEYAGIHFPVTMSDAGFKMDNGYGQWGFNNRRHFLSSKQACWDCGYKTLKHGDELSASYTFIGSKTGVFDAFSDPKIFWQSGDKSEDFMRIPGGPIGMCSGSIPKITLLERPSVKVVEEIDGSWSNDALKTRVIGSPLNEFKLIGSNSSGTATLKFLTLQYNAQAATGGEEWKDLQTVYDKETAIEATGLSFSTPQPMTDGIPTAYRQLRFAIGQYDGTVNYSDTFALRPNHLRVMVQAWNQDSWDTNITTKAESRFRVDIRANGQANRLTFQPVAGFTPEIGAENSPVIIYAYGGKKACTLGTIKDGTTEGFATKSFSNAGQALYNDLTYSEVGPLVIAAKEQVGSEWAKVDAKDTVVYSRLMSSTPVTINFTSTNFTLENAEITGARGKSNYAYFDALSDDGAKLAYDLVAASTTGQTFVNFDKDCYSYDVKTTAQLLTDMVDYQNIQIQVRDNYPYPFGMGVLSPQPVRAGQFEDGRARVETVFTLLKTDGRDVPMNPIVVPKRSESVKVEVRNNSETVLFASKSVTIANPFNFFFGRIYIPDIQGDSNEGTLYYEAYCANHGACMMNGLSQKSVSNTDGWYRHTAHTDALLASSQFMAYNPASGSIGALTDGTQTFTLIDLPTTGTIPVDIAHSIDKFPLHLLSSNPGYNGKMTRFYVNRGAAPLPAPKIGVDDQEVSSSVSTSGGVVGSANTETQNALGASRLGN